MGSLSPILKYLRTNFFIMRKLSRDPCFIAEVYSFQTQEKTKILSIG